MTINQLNQRMWPKLRRPRLPPETTTNNNKRHRAQRQHPRLISRRRFTSSHTEPLYSQSRDGILIARHRAAIIHRIHVGTSMPAAVVPIGTRPRHIIVHLLRLPRVSTVPIVPRRVHVRFHHHQRNAPNAPTLIRRRAHPHVRRRRVRPVR